MKKTFNFPFYFGDNVTLKTRPREKRIVTGITVRPSGKMYELACGVETSWHQDVEIEKIEIEKNNKITGFIKK